MRYDVHQHLWPEQVISALSRRTRPPRLKGNVLELGEGSFELDLGAHDPERRLAELDRHGIDVALVSLQPTFDLPACPEVVEAYHAAMPGLLAASQGRLRPWAARTCLESFAGACVSGGELLAGIDELASELERAGQALFVHPGPASPSGRRPAWWPAVVDYTAEMQAAYYAWAAEGASRFPALPVVFAILAGGAPFQLERMCAREAEADPLLRDNVFLDVASYGPRALALTVEAHGSGQLLYGSDTPVLDAGQTLGALTALGQSVYDAATSANPTRLFA